MAPSVVSMAFISCFILPRAMILRTLGVFFWSTDCFDLWLQRADGCVHILETLSHGAPPLGSFPLSVQTFSCFIGVTKYLHEAAVILAAVNRELHICSICQGVWVLSLDCWPSEHPHCLLRWWRTNPFLTATANSFCNKIHLRK